MRIFKWSTETIVCKDDYSLESFSFEIETISNKRKEVFEISKRKTVELLKQKKQKFQRINILSGVKRFRFMMMFKLFMKIFRWIPNGHLKQYWLL
jgi:hypothetical protein